MQASNASLSIQDPSDHVALPAVEPVMSGQTEAEVDDGSALEAYTDFPDVPFERVDLPGVSEIPVANTSTSPPVDEDEHQDVFRPPPEWCVDMGSSISAMSSFELWMALANGEVGPKTRVWGLGMDNWEAVRNVPELAHALEDSLSLAPPPPVIPTPAANSSVRGHDRTPLGFGTTDSTNEENPAQSGPRSRHGKRFGSARVAIAAGCLAAAAAVGLTLMPKTSDGTSQAAARLPVAVARLQGAMERANRQVDEAAQRRREAEAARAVEPVAPASTSARQHREAGQRRSRRGHH
ncbi:MAG TPA: DUF4339 domain-containing protein [Polyangium sp.]|nr:DUF4339 domain-containing protein [Polyangium sp.]